MSRPHRYRAPDADLGVLAAPPAPDALAELGPEAERLDASPLPFLGLSLGELRRRAADEVIAAARAYHADTGESVPDATAGRLLVAGHQPELFHPGVWAKNFVLARRARRSGRVALNLVVDNDTVKSLAVTLPANGRATRVHFDGGPAEVPWEERPVADEATFAAFPEAIADRTRDWPFRPLLNRFWADARVAASPLLGERFAAGRRALERRWGCHNLELPVSRLSGTAAFASFAGQLLADAEPLRVAYNGCLADYRKAHRLRGRAHPVPDLARDGDAIEVPLWAWVPGETRRGRLFTRATPAGMELILGGRATVTLPPPSRPAEFVAAWRDLEAAGLRVRPRALATTLFARLCLADGFLHGIGGGKYDELTDAIAVRHFGVRPAAYAVLSATLRLPLPCPAVTPDDRQRLARLARDVAWNPWRHLPADAPPEALALVDRRQSVVAESPPTRRGRRQRYRELLSLTEALRPFASAAAEGAAQALAETDADLAVRAVLRRRDFSFVLFPEALLRPFLTSVE